MGQGGDPFFFPPAILALLCDPHCLTPTLPSWRHAIPSWAVGPTLAAPLSPNPHQVLQGRGGHSAKGFIRANEGSALQMPVQDTGKYQNHPQPLHHGLVLSSLLPRGHTLGRGKGDLEVSSQVQRVPWCQGKMGMRGLNQKRASRWGRGLTWAPKAPRSTAQSKTTHQQTLAPSCPPFHGT